MFSHLNDYITSASPGDLVACERGWVMQLGDKLVEPCEKTHIFLLYWKNSEAERLYKDPDERTYRYGSGCRRSNTDPNGFWERRYLDLQREWTGQGLRATSVHLNFLHNTT